MPTAETLKQEICEIGRRIYAKGFAAANEGNISARLDEHTVLCTPTRHCKGFMEPADICTVDMEGKQLAGKRKRTSEVFLHLEIYKQRSDIQSIVHCHPPHATAFAVAREPIPQCVLPEPDVFLGEVPIACYETPGSWNFAETIRPFVDRTNTIILANHGTVSYDVKLENAYWLTEILDAYCRILILAKQLGGIRYLPKDKGEELLDLRREWGFDDPRFELNRDDCNICGHVSTRATWKQAGLEQTAFPPHPSLKNPSHSPTDTEPRLSEADLDRLATKIAEKLRQQV